MNSEDHCHRHSPQNGPVLTIRSCSGLSGDMFCCGLGALWLDWRKIDPTSPEAQGLLNDLAGAIMPDLAGSVAIGRKAVNGICGYHLAVNLPHEHEHRTPGDIEAILVKSGLEEAARDLALSCFTLLAGCEAAVHGKKISEVHFHEVGALDSILDIALASALYVKLGTPKIVCGPLPLADGQISCAHGIMPAPAPAVLGLLPGVMVKPYAAQNAGELVTPTAIALLRALGASFGPWPEFYVQSTALVYGTREFADAPNGVIFALGEAN